MKEKIKTSLIVISILLGLYILLINIFIYPCITKGISMYPIIVPNEIKFTNRWKIVGENYNIKRGDIVLIEKPDILYVEKEKYKNTKLVATYEKKIVLNPFRERLMKRIIGLEGDQIQIDKDERLWINGEIYHENYLENEYTDRKYVTEMEYMYIDLVVPKNTIYVMGDNRSNSIDSRSFGCVPLEKIYSVLIEK